MEDELKEPETIPGEKFGHLRKQYEPQREEAGRVLKDSGINPETPEFRKARANVARRLLEKTFEGEIDPLTNILNRKGFERRLREECSRAERYGHKLTLLFLDLNEFKTVNDTMGHAEGDKLLKEFASILREKSRASDVVARWGGDEFVVLFPETSSDQGQLAWERFSKLFGPRNLSVSAGLAEVDPNNAEGSIKKADQAMFEAKEVSKKLGRSHLKTAF